MRGSPLRVEKHRKRGDVGLEAAGGAGDLEGLEKWVAAVAKLVPGEVVAAYLAGRSVLLGTAEPAMPAADDQGWWVAWTLICLLSVIGLRRWMTSDQSAGVPPEWSAVTLSALSFCVWVYSFGDVFKLFDLWHAKGSALILIAWTLVAPLILILLKKLFREGSG